MRIQENLKIESKSVKLEVKDAERLNKIAQFKKRRPHYLMKEAIHEYIEREEARMDFILSAEESAKHFEETNLHVSLDDFENWANDIENNKETEIPKCHK